VLLLATQVFQGSAMSIATKVRAGWTVSGTALLVLGVAAAAVPNSFAQSAQKLPDAQVESNVLRALAGATALSTQNIQSTTTYGVVTLTGTVQTEDLRSQAENLTARAMGVQKVVDRLQLGDPGPVEPATATQSATQAADTAAPAGEGQDAAAGQANDAQGPPPGMVLQSDGSYAAPPPDEQAAGEQDGGGMSQQANSQPGTQQSSQQGTQSGNYPPGAGVPPPVPAPDGGYSQRRPMYQPGQDAPVYEGGQVGGQLVTVPTGATLNVRINRGLRTDHTKPGTNFTGTVMQDVVAGGAIVIPRGAQIQGTVVDAKKAGVLKGRGELALEVNGLSLGGQQYGLASDVWTRTGPDKTKRTVNNAVVGGVIGALFGAAVGGGEGAAVGAGVGGGLGVANSAASNGNLAVPPESLLTFHLAEPVQVTTVSQAEMQRLAYAAGPLRPRHPRRYNENGYPY
jgi:hypothetical protein